jgi:hypothetical protein
LSLDKNYKLVRKAGFMEYIEWVNIQGLGCKGSLMRVLIMLQNDKQNFDDILHQTEMVLGNGV